MAKVVGKTPPVRDLETVSERVGPLLRDGGRVLMTGATGFVGRWVVGVVLTTAARRQTSHDIVVITRNPGNIDGLFGPLPLGVTISAVHPDDVNQISPMGITDVAHFSAYTGTQNAASSLKTLQADLEVLFSVGRLLERGDTRANLIYASSGAVYGRGQTSSVHPTEESTATHDLSGLGNRYDETKRASESLVRAFSEAGVVQGSIARLFAFSGPLLPIDQHFAIGNFVRDVLMRRDVEVRGSGRDFRSWMYAADMAEVLMRLWNLGDSEGTAYNVGSKEEMSIMDAALTVADVGGVQVRHLWNGTVDSPPTYYVPDVTKLDSVMETGHFLGLRESVMRHLEWLRT